jgi:hypothetical protein
VSDDVEWRLLEWVEGPAAERSSVFREVRERHPEIEGLSDEWLRVDVVCGRDGISRTGSVIGRSRDTFPKDQLALFRRVVVLLVRSR